MSNKSKDHLIVRMPEPHKGFFCDGVLVMQSRNIVESLPTLFHEEQFARVIEIGTAFGGLAVFIRAYLEFDGEIITYDIKDCPAEHPNYSHADFRTDPTVDVHERFARYGIDFRIADVFDIETQCEIANLISQPGRTLLVCDGGDKAREINTFSEYLKPGDVILGHDYYLNGVPEPSIWPVCELSGRMIEQSLAINNVPMRNEYTDLFRDSVLFIGIKEE